MGGATALGAVFEPVQPPTTFEETVERLGTAIRLGLPPPAPPRPLRAAGAPPPPRAPLPAAGRRRGGRAGTRRGGSGRRSGSGSCPPPRGCPLSASSPS